MVCTARLAKAGGGEGLAGREESPYFIQVALEGLAVEVTLEDRQRELPVQRP